MNIKKIIKKGKGISKFLKKPFMPQIIIICIVILGLSTVAIGVRKTLLSENKTIKIGFEDIGELATQTNHTTKLNVIEDSRNLFGVTIPFTQSKYIYSYDIDIKAGFDFKDIEWKENGNEIEVKLPEAKILSNEIDLDSFKVYHEKESIFSQITIAENNDSMKELRKKAEEESIENGLLENARTNAEAILTAFFGNKYDLEKYKVVFKDK